MIIENKKREVGRGNKKQAELLHTVMECVCLCVCLCPCVPVSMCVVHPHRATVVSCSIPQARAEEIWVLVAPEGSQALCCTHC